MSDTDRPNMPEIGHVRLRLIIDDGHGAQYADADVPVEQLLYPAEKLAALYLVPMLLAALNVRADKDSAEWRARLIP